MMSVSKASKKDSEEVKGDGDMIDGIAHGGHGALSCTYSELAIKNLFSILIHGCKFSLSSMRLFVEMGGMTFMEPLFPDEDQEVPIYAETMTALFSTILPLTEIDPRSVTQYISMTHRPLNPDEALTKQIEALEAEKKGFFKDMPVEFYA